MPVEGGFGAERREREREGEGRGLSWTSAREMVMLRRKKEWYDFFALEFYELDDAQTIGKTE